MDVHATLAADAAAATGGAPVVARTPEQLGTAAPIEGTPYRITFKDYFPDFVIGERGIDTRSAEPTNPAVSFLLSGPEGDDADLLDHVAGLEARRLGGRDSRRLA